MQLYRKNLLKNIIELVETSFFFINDQHEIWLKNKNNLLSLLKKENTEHEFLKGIDEFLIKLGDAHTRLFFPNIPDKILKENFEWLNDELYLFYNDEAYLVEKINKYYVSDLKIIYKNMYINYPEVMIYNELLQDLKFGNRYFYDNYIYIMVNKNNEGFKIILNRINTNEWLNEIKIKMKSENILKDKIIIEKVNSRTIIVRILSFREKELNNILKKKLKDIKSNYDTVIIDLRNNNGGYIDVAKKITENFISQDTILEYEVKERKGSEFITSKNEIKSNMSSYFKDKTKIVFVNDKTMSSAEYIFVKSLSQEKCIIVGCETAGLSNQAVVHDLGNNIILQVTTKRYFDKNEPVNRGIFPDIQIKITPDNYLNGIDDYIIWFNDWEQQLAV